MPFFACMGSMMEWSLENTSGDDNAFCGENSPMRRLPIVSDIWREVDSSWRTYSNGLALAHC